MGTKLLLIEDNPGDADLVHKVASKSRETFDIQWCGRLADAIARPDLATFDVILTDLSLPDSQGLETVTKIREHVADIPVVVLTSLSDDVSTPSALEMGAQDFLVKDEINPALLLRSIRYAILRQHAIRENSRLMAVLRDNTELLERKNRRLARLYRTAQKFVDNVSHEFRTPLTVIKEYASLIREQVTGDVNDEQARLLTVIEDRADDLNTMVDDMLDVSKLRAGIMGIHRRECQVADIVSHALPALQRKAIVQGVSLETDVDPGLPPVFCDDEKAGRVVINLVVNAIKFCGERGRVRLWANPQGDHDVLVGVTDNGPGISEERQREVFKRFRQLSTEQARGSTKGFGLGLSIAQQLVQLNFGQIGLQSKLGEGTTFTFTLPVAEPLEIVRRYMARRAESRSVGKLVTLVAARMAGPVEAAGSDDAHAFLQYSVRRADLLLRLDDGAWMLFLSAPAAELRRALDRIRAGRAAANRNRLHGPLPEIDFETIGSWRIGDQRDDVLAAVAELCTPLEVTHA
jgi:signal transduction histidine kinase